MASKVLLARIPMSYATWRKLGVFRHGSLSQQLASSMARLEAGMEVHARLGSGTVRRVMELGPGDSLGLALAARARDASSVFVDVGDFAAFDSGAYLDVAKQCGGEAFADELNLSSRAAMLASCSAEYLTNGLSSLKGLPDDSVDLSLSTAVLEHIRVEEFDQTMQELFRVTRAGGTGRHIVDVMDHLGGGLNNLRFPTSFWEHDWVAKSGFYTNRLRPSQIISSARHAGFKAEIRSGAVFPKSPLKITKMACEFRALPAADFEIAFFEMVLRKP